jgi:DNA-binding beta-propeller fold protein YncE
MVGPPPGFGHSANVSLPVAILLGALTVLLVLPPSGGPTAHSSIERSPIHSAVIVPSGNDSLSTPPLPSIGVNGTGVVYDPANGNLYIASAANGTVLVVNATSRQMIAPPIPVGPRPTLMAIDSQNGNVYVVTTGNSSDSGVAAINGGTNRLVPLNITVGQQPAGIAFDPQNGFVYVSNALSDNISVINGSLNQLVQPIAMFGPGPLAYDPQTGDLYVGEGRSVPGSGAGGVIDTTTSLVENDSSGAYGLGTLTYDSETGNLYGIAYGFRGAEYLSMVNGTTEGATGIPDPGAGGGIVVEGNTGRVIVGDRVLLASNDSFLEPSLPILVGSGAYDPTTGWVFSVDLYAFAGGPILGIHESGVYQLQFVATGLPNGTDWSVALGVNYWNATGHYYTRVGNHSFTNSLVMSAWNGSYSYEVMPVAGYNFNRFGIITVNGPGAIATIQFSGFPNFDVSVTFIELGLPSGTPWNVSITDGSLAGPAIWTATGGAVTVELTNGSYVATAAASGYVSSSGPTHFVVNSLDPPNQTILFTAAPAVGIPTQSHGLPGITLVEIAVGLAAASLALAATAVVLVLRGRRPPPAARVPPERTDVSP